MTGNEERRRQLDSAGERLRDELSWLAARAVPGTAAETVLLSGPAVVDWHRPVSYRYEASTRVLGSGYDAAVIDRASAALDGAGWTVTVTRSDDGTGQTTVTGEKDGFQLRVDAQEGYAGTVFTGTTPASALETAAESAPEPVATPDTLGPDEVLCYECDGLGWCPACYGRGWMPDGLTGRHRCRECLGTKVCPVCRGDGKLAMELLTAADLAHYPALRSADEERDR